MAKHFQQLKIVYFRSKRLFLISEHCAGYVYELSVISKFTKDYEDFVTFMENAYPHIYVSVSMLRKYCTKDSLMRKCCSEVCEMMQEKGEDVLGPALLSFLTQYSKNVPLFTIDLVRMSKQLKSKSIH